MRFGRSPQGTPDIPAKGGMILKGTALCREFGICWIGT
jgi:hypothetical protein